MVQLRFTYRTDRTEKGNSISSTFSLTQIHFDGCALPIIHLSENSQYPGNNLFHFQYLPKRWVQI